MKRVLPRNRFYLTLTLPVLVLLGCGGGGAGGPVEPPPTVVAPDPEPEPTGLWVSGEEGSAVSGFSASVPREIVAAPVLQAPGFAGPEADTGATGFSGTYSLESSIDEHDIVKYNGSTLAIAPGHSGCCFAFESAADSQLLPGPIDSTPGVVRLYSTDPAAGSAVPGAEIEVGSSLTVEGLYLTGTDLQVLSSSAWWGTFGEPLLVPDYWQAQITRLAAWDIADADNPIAGGVLEIEGALLLSRRVGEEIHLVTRHTPDIKGLIYAPQTEEELASNAAVLESLAPDALSPRLTYRDEAVAMPAPDSCYRTDLEHPLALERPLELSMTTLLTVSASTGELIRSACILDPVSGVALTEDSAIFTYVDYQQAGSTTTLHSLALADWSYRGSARVDGYLYTGGNADFRINQDNGVLRVVTTRFTNDEDDRWDHFLYTLRPNPTLPELDTLARLPEEGGEELGKPNEDLYGVRFVGARAYLVTFERIDPLYVIDLSDPAAPRIDGVLEVPGFSDLLHPVSEDLLFGVGSNGEGYAKVELFDVSDTQAPRSVGSLEFLTDYNSSFSPAQYNRYAFTTLAGEASDRIAIPVSGWRSGVEGFESAQRIVLMEVTQKSDPARSQLVLQGEVVLPENLPVSDQTRTVLDGEAIYVSVQGALLSGFWSNPEAVEPVTKGL